MENPLHTDENGFKTLSVIEEAVHFNQWMYETIKPYCSGKILEIGSGIGNISQFFLEDKFNITLSDFQDSYCQFLINKFCKYPNLKEVIKLDLIDNKFESKYKDQFGSYDTVYALNVIEHIENEQLAISNCYKLLKPGGNLIILVPAFPSLYNRFDAALGHYRRYTKNSLNTLLLSEKASLLHTTYFNAAGILGWFVSGKIQGNQNIPQGQMSFYNSLVPVFKLIDIFLFGKTGLSVVSVAAKGHTN